MRSRALLYLTDSRFIVSTEEFATIEEARAAYPDHRGLKVMRLLNDYGTTSSNGTDVRLSEVDG